MTRPQYASIILQLRQPLPGILNSGAAGVGVILKKRDKVRTETMKMRRELNRLAMLEPLPNGVS